MYNVFQLRVTIRKQRAQIFENEPGLACRIVGNVSRLRILPKKPRRKDHVADARTQGYGRCAVTKSLYLD